MFLKFWTWIKNFQILTSARKERNTVCSQRLEGADWELRECLCEEVIFKLRGGSARVWGVSLASLSFVKFFVKIALQTFRASRPSSNQITAPQSLSCIENLELWFRVVRSRKSQGKFSPVKEAASTERTRSAWDLGFDRSAWLLFTEWGEWDKLCCKTYLGGFYYLQVGLPHFSASLSWSDSVQVHLLQIT